MKLRQRLFGWLAGLLTASILAACSPQPSPIPTGAASPEPDPTSALTRTDAQGSVEFAVTPRNLEAAGASLEFLVAMNTHSVDLAWDLAAQSTLKTDTGLEVTGANWPVGSGHHYEATLTFPSQTADGQALLAGAKALTLTIRDTDVPERVFVWQLGQ